METVALLLGIFLLGVVWCVSALAEEYGDKIWTVFGVVCAISAVICITMAMIGWSTF